MSKSNYILRALDGSIWAMDEAKLEALSEVVANRARGGMKLSAEEVRAIQRPKPMGGRRGAVAVLPLFGVMAQRMDMMTAISGGTSTENFAREFNALVEDDGVSAIVLDVDSPGGAVAGVAELADTIYAARGTKPIIAVANSQMCSAAYWACSAADEIVATSGSFVGSLSAVMVRVDASEADAEAGIKYHFITGAPYKAEGNPHLPATESEIDALQANVDEAHRMFVEAVARNRGITTAQVEKDYGKGRAMIGRLAVEAGLADRVGTLDEVIRELTGSRQSRSGARAEFGADIVTLPLAATFNGDRIWIQASGANTVDGNVTIGGSSMTITKDTADAGGAAPEVIEPPAIEPAPEARSAPMPENGTAAPQNGATDPIAAERLRIAELRGLSALGATQAQIDGWVDNGASYETAAKEVMSKAKAAGANGATASGGDVIVGANRVEQDPRKGFASHREFLLTAIQNSGLRDRGQVSDDRLKVLAVNDDADKSASRELAFLLPEAFTPASLRAAAGSDEQGTYDHRYGGAAVPTSILAGIKQLGMEADPSAGRTTSIPMATPTVEILARTDKNHQTSVAGGLTVTRRPETVAADSSRMSIEKVTLKASGLFMLAYESEELLTDSAISFAALIAQGARDQFAHKILSEKIRGVGGGEYLGILNSPAKVAVAAEGGQSADTILALNVLKMRARAWNYSNAIWIANHDTYVQLAQAAIVVEGSVGGGLVTVFQPSLVSDRPDMLLGRPIFFSEYASTLGDEGDIMLVNFSQYLEGTYQPLQSAESVHVRFVEHERVFKMWTRNAGAPWWRSALTPHKGAATLSPIVTLAAR